MSESQFDNNDNQQGEVGGEDVKRGLAQMLKGGVLMDVVTPEQAVIAEEAGAVACNGTGACSCRYPCEWWGGKNV